RSRNFIGTSQEQGFGVGELGNTSADGKRNIYFAGNRLYQFKRGFSFFVRCRDVEENQLIGTLTGVLPGQFHRIASVLQIYKVHAFYGATIFHVEAWNDPFSQV